MFLNNQLVDTIRVNTLKLHVPGYIESLKMEMEDKNEDIIDLTNEEPQFFIENVPSAMNADFTRHEIQPTRTRYTNW